MLSQPRTARKAASNSWRRSESGTARMRMTMGLTLRRTARRINRLNGAGSVAKLAKPSGRVESHADHPEQSLQMAPFPRRGDSPMRSLVSTISLGLRARFRTSRGRRRGGPSLLHLALGADLCARAEQTLPAPSETHQQELSDRRDVYKGQG